MGRNDKTEKKANEIIVAAREQLKKGANTAKDKAQIAFRTGEEKYKDLKESTEYKLLHPIFIDDIESPEYALPEMIRIEASDKKHKNSEICRGSIGYEFKCNGMRVLSVFPEHSHEIGITFENGEIEGLYLVNPIDDKYYIPINNYFKYLKEKKVNELCRIAQDLGAKELSISLKEESKVFAKKKTKGKINNEGKDVANFDLDTSNKTYEKTEILCKETYMGRPPKEPKREYFKHEQNITSLIKARLSENTLIEKKYTFKYTNSADLSEKKAIKIDGAIRKMKYEGNTSLQHEVVDENFLSFEYEIHF